MKNVIIAVAILLIILTAWPLTLMLGGKAYLIPSWWRIVIMVVISLGFISTVIASIIEKEEKFDEFD